jgi:hypothetical protein
MGISRGVGVFLVAITALFGNAEAQLPSGAAASDGWRSARYYGGTNYEFAERLVVDAAGNSYFLGYTFSADMDPAIVPVSRASGEPASATFVYKVTPEGAQAYAAAVGTGIAVRPIDLAVGADGSAHVLVRDGDVRHVIRLDAAGREMVHVSLDPRVEEIYPRAIAVDDVGNSVIAGWTGDRGLFIARIDQRGAMSIVYRVHASADVRDVAVDAAGNAYLIGIAFEDDLPITAGALERQFKAGACPPSPCTDAFVLKVTRTGTLAYATYFGGTGWDDGWTIAVDRAGFAIIGGETQSVDLPLVAAAKPLCHPGVLSPCGDGYLAKLDPRGAALVFSTYVGARAGHLAVDALGTVYAAGATGSGLTMYRAPQPVFGGGDSDGFAIAYSPMGQVLWSTYVGGSREDAVLGIGAAGGRVYFGGVTMSADLASDDAPFHGARDLFLARVLDPLAP